MRRCTEETLFQIQPQFFVVLAIAILLIPAPWLLAWLVACIVHEIGHCIAIRLSGKRIYRVDITCRGIKLGIDPLGKVEWLCALAGPVAGLSMLVFYKLLPRLAICALVQSAFNLLPIYPMDGGRILSCLLRLRFTEKITGICIQIVGVVMCILLAIFFIVIMQSMGVYIIAVLLVLFWWGRVRKRKSSCKEDRLWVQ